MKNLKAYYTETLLEMLQTKPLDNITVSDLVEKCGTSRQAFYYHFKDIYDIVEQYFLSQAELRPETVTAENWNLGYLRLTEFLFQNKNLVMNINSSVRRNAIDRFCYLNIYRYVIAVVTKENETIKASSEQCKWAADFYTLSLSAVILSWIRGGMKESPKKMAEIVKILMKSNFKSALENLKRENVK